MTTRGLQPRLSYPARLSIKMEGQIRSFPDKRGLKEYTSTQEYFMTHAHTHKKEYTSTKPALQEMLKGLL